MVNNFRTLAKMAELVDAHDSKSCTVRCVGSIPTFGTGTRASRNNFPDVLFYLWGGLSYRTIGILSRIFFLIHQY
jgi:hypothetical protein